VWVSLEFSDGIDEVLAAAAQIVRCVVRVKWYITAYAVRKPNNFETLHLTTHQDCVHRILAQHFCKQEIQSHGFMDRNNTALGRFQRTEDSTNHSSKEPETHWQTNVRSEIQNIEKKIITSIRFRIFSITTNRQPTAVATIAQELHQQNQNIKLCLRYLPKSALVLFQERFRGGKMEEETAQTNLQAASWAWGMQVR
jgi:hypothetical protein